MESKKYLKHFRVIPWFCLNTDNFDIETVTEYGFPALA